MDLKKAEKLIVAELEKVKDLEEKIEHLENEIDDYYERGLILEESLEEERNLRATEKIGTDSLDDEMKRSFLRQNFEKITLEQLENLLLK